jgi:hypothetical protein
MGRLLLNDGKSADINKKQEETETDIGCQYEKVKDYGGFITKRRLLT